jgi:hypothetical protein
MVAVGFLGSSRPQSISVSDNSQVQGCLISPSHAVLQLGCMYPHGRDTCYQCPSSFFHSYGFTQRERLVRRWNPIP